LLAVAIASPVFADSVNVVGRATGQYSTAAVVCSFNPQTNTLTFTAANTSDDTQPGSTATITAIGFDLPHVGNVVSSGLNGFTGEQAPNLSSTFTFSDAALGSVPGISLPVLDFGFITGSSGEFSSGLVEDGLLPGESASFTVTGAAFAGFTESHLCNAILVRFLLITGSASATDVGVTPDSSFVELQPDARIKRPGGIRKGDNVYNTTAEGQTQTLRRSGPSLRRVWLSVQNDGETADSFALSVSGATPAGYELHYYHGRTNNELTTQIEAGTFVTPQLAPGHRYRIRVSVRTTAAAQRGSELDRLFIFTSLGDSSAQDAAKLIVIRV
jgi:hypothetical protein